MDKKKSLKIKIEKTTKKEKIEFLLFSIIALVIIYFVLRWHMIKEIEELLNGNITAYKLGKETDLNINMLQKYISGERKVENMTLKTAEKLYKYYIETKKEK